MANINKIELVASSYRQRPNLDIVIDGKPLARHLYPKDEIVGVISPFGWSGEWGRRLETQVAASLLLKSESEFATGRRQVLVCCECGDTGCGAATAEIVKEDGFFIWRRFGFENNFEDRISFVSVQHIPQFAFDKHEYSALFRHFLTQSLP